MRCKNFKLLFTNFFGFRPNPLLLSQMPAIFFFYVLFIICECMENGGAKDDMNHFATFDQQLIFDWDRLNTSDIIAY